ncbi:hypothetical protein O5D80_002342 [Batrachochytrium dendrobatidis]|nr:hypothetical protein O5D80_002342 [Batrachochytrium dendrobatidis]
MASKRTCFTNCWNKKYCYTRFNKPTGFLSQYRSYAPIQPVSIPAIPNNQNIGSKKIITETLNGKQRHYYLDQTIHQPDSDRYQRPVFEWAHLEEGQSMSNGAFSKSYASDRHPSTTRSDQSHIRFLGHVNQWFRNMFLPVGYPSSVHGCYKKVHMWLFAENVAGSAISVLTAQAMLTSIGASTAAHETAALAIAVDWVLKDGIGELGKMLMIQRFAHQFDTHPKRWKLYGEACSISGALMQLATCITNPHHFLFFASIGVGLRSMHYSIWAATHTTFTRNMATHNGVNVGDIVAKADSQLSLAHLLGMVSGIGMLAVSFQPAALFAWFSVLSAIQIVCTGLLLREARFEVLDQYRLVLIPREFMSEKNALRIPTLDQVVRFENWLNEGLSKGQVVTDLSIGVTVDDAFKHSRLSHALQIFKNGKYLLGFKLADSTHSQIKVYVVLHQSIQPVHVIQAAFHAVRFEKEIIRQTQSTGAPISLHDAENILESSLAWTLDNFPAYLDGLEEQKWKTDLIIWGDRGIRVVWDIEE